MSSFQYFNALQRADASQNLDGLLEALARVTALLLGVRRVEEDGKVVMDLLGFERDEATLYLGALLDAIGEKAGAKRPVPYPPARDPL